MHADLPQGEQPVLRIIPMPADTNAHGTIFGGWVMAQVDLAGSVPAYERAQGPIVTVAVNSFLFKEPVFVGDLVSFYARVARVGRTSITVDVESSPNAARWTHGRREGDGGAAHLRRDRRRAPSEGRSRGPWSRNEPEA
jgi:acyl-CoA thioesterase YciA